MANFENAYNKTMTNEGGYVNDSTDVGGETYKGISRKFNPSWSGWEVIDRERHRADFPDCLNYDNDLQSDVHSFYKSNYWDVNKLDNIKSQIIAEEMFDTGVNMGVKRAAEFLQKSLNYLNRNGSLFPDLIVDGNIGKKSLDAFNIIMMGQNDEQILLTMLNVLQGQHYMDYMDKSPSQRKYARGWFRRVKL